MGNDDAVKVQNLIEGDLDKWGTLLSKAFYANKRDFLRAHGHWWYRGYQNQWVLKSGDTLGGYCAYIPVKIHLGNEAVSAVWWVDLFIDNAFRGKGYQRLFDEKIRDAGDVILGFSNETAAKIHKKHGWGVREDFQVRLLPLYPPGMRTVRRRKGLIGAVVRLIGWCLLPFTWLYFRLSLLFNSPRSGFRIEEQIPELIADVYSRYIDDTMVTTVRDVEYIRWRYFDAPYFDELVFYGSGPKDAPKMYMIARHVPASEDNYPVTRILDVFGDFQNGKALKELLNLVKQDSIARGSSQILIMAAIPEVQSASRSVGFWLSAPARFCWFSKSYELMDVFTGRLYWTLSDSDNDL